MIYIRPLFFDGDLYDFTILIIMSTFSPPPLLNYYLNRCLYYNLGYYYYLFSTNFTSKYITALSKEYENVLV